MCVHMGQGALGFGMAGGVKWHEEDHRRRSIFDQDLI